MTAGIRRRVSTATTVTRAARLNPEPFLDGVHRFDRVRMPTRRSSSRRAYEEALQRRAASRRLGPPYDYLSAYIPTPSERTTSPRTTSPRARPTRRWRSRRRQRRPQSTASLSGSAVLRELMILYLRRSLLHNPARRRSVGPVRTWRLLFRPMHRRPYMGIFVPRGGGVERSVALGGEHGRRVVGRREAAAMRTIVRAFLSAPLFSR
jgi:hypothetical protein